MSFPPNKPQQKFPESKTGDPTKKYCTVVQMKTFKDFKCSLSGIVATCVSAWAKKPD
jgi:hypothetical protein